MSWANLREIIFEERKNIESGSSVDFFPESAFETEQSAILGCYLRTKSQVDTAISHFADTLQWPELNPQERFFIAARLDFAWEIVSILQTGHDGDPLIAYPSETCETADLLRWLLIEIWPYACGRFLQAQRSTAEQTPRHLTDRKVGLRESSMLNFSVRR
jgi:hypothetical protein